MTLSLENKQGGKLKRWSLTTALWPRETGATVTCEQRCNIPLGMCCDVCAHTLLFVFQQCHSWNVTVLCLNVGLCAFQCQRSYSNNVNLRAKWKHCDKRNLVGTTPFFFLLFFFGSYLHYAARCQNERFTYQCQENAVRVSVNVWLTNSLIWLWHTNPVGTVLPEGTSVTPCSDSHFTSQPRPLSWGLPGTYTTKPCPRPPSLVLGAQIP